MREKTRLKQNLSTNSLFHFVNKIDYLIDIIDNGFQARYCYERTPIGQIPYAFPMKCFCDIPLGTIKYHIGTYGMYGIGVSKQFAKKHGITPLIYVHKNSNTLIRYANENKLDHSGNSDEQKKLINSLIPYFKSYDENKPTVNDQEKYFRYYDEREWRYIPEDADCLYLGNIIETEIDNEVKKRNAVLRSDQFRLTIPHTSITYIFVEYESDKKAVIDRIRTKFRSTKRQDELISKILSAHRITRDF